MLLIQEIKSQEHCTGDSSILKNSLDTNTHLALVSLFCVCLWCIPFQIWSCDVQVRNGLVPLIQEIKAKGTPPDSSILQGSFDTKAQSALCNAIAVDLGFSLQQGRLDVSVHPFTGGRFVPLLCLVREKCSQAEFTLISLLHNSTVRFMQCHCCSAYDRAGLMSHGTLSLEVGACFFCAASNFCWNFFRVSKLSVYNLPHKDSVCFLTWHCSRSLVRVITGQA